MVTWKRAMRENPGELTAAMSHTALALTLWMDRDGGFNGKPPSATTIAEATGKKRSAVSYAIDKLGESGWLQITKRPGRTSLLHAAVPDRIVADAPFGAMVRDREPSIDAGELSTTFRTGVQADTVNLPNRGTGTFRNGAQVTARESEHLPNRGPGPSEMGHTKSSPSLYNSLSTKVLTPDQHPDLWERAKVITEQRTNVGDPQAYRLTVYRKLVAETNGQQQDCTHIWHLGRNEAGEYIDLCRCGTTRPRQDTPT